MPSDEQFEELLRKAPAPSAPFGLEQRLIQQATQPNRTRTTSWSWFSIFHERRWAPALALFLVLAGLITALGFQQSTLIDLKRAQQELAAQLPPPNRQAQAEEQNRAERELAELQKQSAELQRLRTEMADIQQLLAQHPAIAQENAALRAELSNLAKNNPELSPEFQAALEEARKKAARIKCVNNLKNIGLAARIWAADNADHLPRDFVTMKNELSTPKIVVCPSDPSRAQGIENWDQFAAIGASYEILSPGVATTVGSAVYARCPFHNNVCLTDGSVQQLRQNQQLIQRDGHWEIGE